MATVSNQKYWFPAKRFGWGWGPPSTWQGWVVLLAYFVLIVGGVPLIQATRGSVVYLAYAMGLTVLLIVVCWLKGEPPRWRT